MRRYLLDTTVLAAYLYDRRTARELVESWISAAEAATSILVHGEVIEHLKSRPSFEPHEAQLRELLRAVQPYFLTYSIMDRYAEIRRSLRGPRGPGLIGDIDTLIAATALERNLTVVTTDSDFERVPDLKVQLVARRALEAER